MVRDDELRPARRRLLYDRIAHVEADEDARDARPRAADEQTGVVPRLREMARRDLLHEVHDVLTCHHTSISSNAAIRCWTARYFALVFARALLSIPAAARRTRKS